MSKRIVLNCVEVANKICYIPKRTLVMASSGDIEVEEEFAPTSRPTLRYSEPELAEQTQVPRKVRVATSTLAKRTQLVIYNGASSQLQWLHYGVP